jgi:hypothetical protein
MPRRLRLLLRATLALTAAATAALVLRHPNLLIRFARGEPVRQTVRDVVKKHGGGVEELFRPKLEQAGQDWPPKHLQLLAFKHEQRLEVWAGDKRDALVKIATYPFTAMSGELGPKAKQGDLQIPEGIYGLPVLNPNSSYHLSIRVNYPNKDDIARSKIGRRGMGGDIYVHGENVTIGCIPLGNNAIEEVFTLAALVPAKRRGILISPVDFRRPIPAGVELPPYAKLYGKLKGALSRYEAGD